MSWWQILILVLGTSAGAALLTVLLTKRFYGKELLDRATLLSIEKTRLETVAKVHKRRTEELEAITVDLAAKLKQTKLALAERLKEISDDQKADYDRLVSSGNALLGKIDSVLAAARSR